MTIESSYLKTKLAIKLINISDKLDSIVKSAAAIFCWSSAALILTIFVNVAMRYGFNNGLILFEEIQWHLYAIGIMFGLSYAEITNSQVRVDVLASTLSEKTRLFWDVFGAVFFLYPMAMIILFNSMEYVSTSFALSEASSSPLGMPYRWAIKAVIPASFILLVMASASRLLRCSIVLFYGDKQWK